MEAQKLGALRDYTFGPVRSEEVDGVGDNRIGGEHGDLGRKSLQLRWFVRSDHIARPVSSIEALGLQKAESVAYIHSVVIHRVDF